MPFYMPMICQSKRSKLSKLKKVENQVWNSNRGTNALNRFIVRFLAVKRALTNIKGKSSLGSRASSFFLFNLEMTQKFPELFIDYYRMLKSVTHWNNILYSSLITNFLIILIRNVLSVVKFIMANILTRIVLECWIWSNKIKFRILKFAKSYPLWSKFQWRHHQCQSHRQRNLADDLGNDHNCSKNHVIGLWLLRIRRWKFKSSALAWFSKTVQFRKYTLSPLSCNRLQLPSSQKLRW